LKLFTSVEMLSHLHVIIIPVDALMKNGVQLTLKIVLVIVQVASVKLIIILQLEIAHLAEISTNKKGGKQND